MEDAPEPEVTPPDVTLESISEQLVSVLEMNDLLHSEMTEIKAVLKAMVDVAKGLTDSEKTTKPISDSDNHSMYG
jgi:hypothetical protein